MSGLNVLQPLLKIGEYVHGTLQTDDSLIEIGWYSAEGQAMDEHAWSGNAEICVVLSETGNDGSASAVAVVINGSLATHDFQIPGGQDWRLAFSSSDDARLGERVLTMPERAIALLISGL